MVQSQTKADNLIRQRNKFEKKYRRLIYRELLNSIKPLIDYLRLYSYQHLSKDLMTSDDMETLYLKMYMEVGNWFWERPKIKQDTGTIELREVFWTDFVKKQVNSRIVTVLETSQGLAFGIIDNAIQEAELDGLSIAETGKLIEQRLLGEFPLSSKFRAQRIAQTEIITAANKGSLEGAMELDTKYKVWLTVGDGKVRDSHASQNYERVLVDQNFSNGLEYPGDVNGPAKEVINCRCTMFYENDDNYEAEI